MSIPIRTTTVLAAVALLAACSASAGRAPGAAAPATPATSARPPLDSVHVEWTPCYGTCPIYSFTFRRGGTATYVGYRFVPVVGTYEAALDATAFGGIERLLRESGFFEMDPRYEAEMTDQPSRIIRAWSAGSERQVLEYGWAGPPGLRELQTALDSAGAHLRWAWTAPAPDYFRR